MASLNKVLLMGNLTRDAELRYISTGSAVLEFGLAVNRTYKSQGSDELKEETCFVEIVLWGRRAEAVAQYLTKGKPLFVEGRLQLDQWEAPDGQKRSKLRVVAENIEFIGGGRGAGGGAPGHASGEDAFAGGQAGPGGGGGGPVGGGGMGGMSGGPGRGGPFARAGAPAGRPMAPPLASAMAPANGGGPAGGYDRGNAQAPASGGAAAAMGLAPDDVPF
jgi:single-strand DNA-binding protein